MYANSKHYWNAEGKPDELLHTSGRMLTTRPRIRITLQTTDFDTMKTDNSGADVTTQARLDFILKAMQVT